MTVNPKTGIPVRPCGLWAVQESNEYVDAQERVLRHNLRAVRAQAHLPRQDYVHTKSGYMLRSQLPHRGRR